MSLIEIVTFSLFNQWDKMFDCVPTLIKKTKYFSKWKITSVSDYLSQIMPTEMYEREATGLFIAYLVNRYLKKYLFLSRQKTYRNLNILFHIYMNL